VYGVVGVGCQGLPLAWKGRVVSQLLSGRHSTKGSLREAPLDFPSHSSTSPAAMLSPATDSNHLGRMPIKQKPREHPYAVRRAPRA